MAAARARGARRTPSFSHKRGYTDDIYIVRGLSECVAVPTIHLAAQQVGMQAVGTARCIAHYTDTYASMYTYSCKHVYMLA